MILFMTRSSAQSSWIRSNVAGAPQRNPRTETQIRTTEPRPWVVLWNLPSALYSAEKKTNVWLLPSQWGATHCSGEWRREQTQGKKGGGGGVEKRCQRRITFPFTAKYNGNILSSARRANSRYLLRKMFHLRGFDDTTDDKNGRYLQRIAHKDGCLCYLTKITFSIQSQNSPGDNKSRISFSVAISIEEFYQPTSFSIYFF